MRTYTQSFTGLSAALLIFASPVFAVNHVVHMTTAHTFSPDYLEIQAGDTVTWHNDSTSDSLGARNDTGFRWDTGGVETLGNSEPVTFTTVGTFPYYDPTYVDDGMTGTIVVSATVAPTPSLIVDAGVVSGAAFAFTVTNLTAGKTTIIETSVNLTAWTPVYTNVPAGTTLNFTNGTAASPKYFRCSQLP